MKKHPLANCGYRYWFFGLGEFYKNQPDGENRYFNAHLFGRSLFAYTACGEAAALYILNRAVWFRVGRKWKFGNLQRGS